MKAEHRKELHTNLLADSMGKLVQKVKSPTSTRAVVMWVIAGLVVVTIGFWLYSVNRASDTAGALWVKLDNQMYDQPSEKFGEDRQGQVLKQFGEIAKDDRHSMPARVARFQEARYLLPLGLKNLASPSRDEAVSNIKQAREIYLQLAKECTDTPVLQQEAYFGAASAEEALTGTPEKEGADKKAGNVATALSLYKKTYEVKKDSYFGRQAAKRIAELEKNPEQVVAFYTELYKRAGPRRLPDPIPPPRPVP
jgi:hypothetical protein